MRALVRLAGVAGAVAALGLAVANHVSFWRGQKRVSALSSWAQSQVGGGMAHYTSLMQSSMPPGEVFSDLAARVGAGGDVTPQATGGVGGWVLTLVSAMALVVVGRYAARVSRRLVSRSTPQLIVLLDQSAAFYSRWPEDRLANAPRGELMAEAARCQRTIELLESRGTAVTGWGSTSHGPIDGLKSWITLLHKQIDERVSSPPGLSHA